jgi:tetratricopeptide (TPR) repeat protein
MSATCDFMVGHCDWNSPHDRHELPNDPKSAFAVEVTVPIDPDNPVVKLCAEGMQAESSGRLDEARERYEQAWTEHSNDYEACIAAHYLARHQSSVEAELEWNRVALAKAARVDADLVSGFYASLYLNLGHSCEKTGDMDAARENLRLAEHHLEAVPDGRYKEIVRGGIENAQERLRHAEVATGPGI